MIGQHTAQEPITPDWAANNHDPRHPITITLGGYELACTLQDLDNLIAAAQDAREHILTEQAKARGRADYGTGIACACGATSVVDGQCIDCHTFLYGNRQAAQS